MKWLYSRFMLVLFFPFLLTGPVAAQTGSNLPQIDGELAVAGLRDRVEILRDGWGVPHIYASNSYDLFFAQGYTQAQDRWWQMEWFRHAGSGTVGELVGKAALGSDIFTRTLGSRRVVEQELEIYAPEVVTMLQAFADGVNAYILNREPGELAVEYSALRLTGITIDIEPWTPADSLIWGKVMAWSLGGNQSIELLLSALRDKLSQEMLDDFVPPWPFGQKPTILFPEDLPLTDASRSALNHDTAGITGISTQLAGSVSPDFDFGVGHGVGIGSNNWVAGGSMTASGKPLLANDPHLSIQMPAIWYEIGLHCQPVSDECPFNVTGFTFAPNAGVVIGHNDRIAWGVTNVGPDVQDLYRIKVNPDNPLEYEWNGAWRKMTIREETIRFGGDREPVTIQVRETHLGPIINDHPIKDGEAHGFNNENPLALRWTGLEPGTIFQSVMMLNRARNWDEFRAALRFWDAPAQNVVYADVEGNIGYQTPGKIPIRAEGHSGLLPVDGSTSQFEWQGYIPFDYLPRIFNPARGFIATANQAVAPPEYYGQLAEELGEGRNYTISQLWAYGYRGQRIVELLQTLAPHTIETFKAIHGDNKNSSAEEILPFLADVDFGDPTLNEARDWLLDWDYQMHMDSPQAALYAVFWATLVDKLYNDQLVGVHHANGNDNELWATYLLMQDPENSWWDDTTTPGMVETRDDIVRIAFEDAYARTVERLGKDRADWRWGDLHTATFVSSPLGRSGIEAVEKTVNRGPVATSGGGEIVNATAWSAASGNFAVNSLPSMRMIVDLSDFDNSLTVITTGESGHPNSDHYDDMIELWRNIEYHPMLWSREQVEKAAKNKLVLLPVQ